MWYMIFSCQGSWWFLHYHIWYHQVSFNYYSKDQFGYFNIDADYISDTYLLKALFKGFSKWIYMLLLFNDFWWKLGGFHFRNLVYSERRSVSDFILTMSSFYLSKFSSFWSSLSCILSKCSSERPNMAWIVVPKTYLVTRGKCDVVMAMDSVEMLMF